MTSEEIIAQFLKEHPNVSKAEWLPEHEILTLWLRDATNPDEPFEKSEFIRYTPTWHLFDDLEQKLLGA